MLFISLKSRPELGFSLVQKVLKTNYSLIAQLPHLKIVDREIARFSEMSFKMYYRLLSVLNSGIASISKFKIATCGTWVIWKRTNSRIRER